MKAVCYGSLNIDYTYDVPHFVMAGETISSTKLGVYTGGKGLNQATALSRAGFETRMAGAIGPDGHFLLEELEKAGVDCRGVAVLTDTRTGNAIIQRDASGGNCIILFGGANQAITADMAQRTLADAEAGDLLVLQNEISATAQIMRIAKEKGMRIALNPSPMNEKILALPLELVDIFLLNEVEAAQLLGYEVRRENGEAAAAALQTKYAGSTVVLTLGGAGSVYADGAQVFTQPAFRRQAVDTTAAGDTFTGYFLASLFTGETPQNAMKTASLAAAVAVTRHGAAPSIPARDEVLAELARL